MTEPLPTFRGKASRRALVARWGLPNAHPTDQELAERGPLAHLTTRRLLFVDDHDGGRPVAIWEP